MKQTAYKVVEEREGRLISLYHKYLGPYTAEYSTKQTTKPEKICFVFENLDYAIFVKSVGCDRQVWLCEGNSAEADWFLRDRSERIGLWIDSESYFMTEVRLLKRVL